MHKNISKLEYTVNDKVYQLLCDSDSPLECVEEALFQFLSYVRHVKSQSAVKQEEAKPEELKEELNE